MPIGGASGGGGMLDAIKAGAKVLAGSGGDDKPKEKDDNIVKIPKDTFVDLLTAAKDSNKGSRLDLRG